MKTSFVAAGCAALLCSPLVIHAQQATVAPAPTVAASPDAFGYGLGSIIVPIEGGAITYAVFQTQSRESKLVGQKIQLRIDSASPGRYATRTLIINTGKFRTVGKIEADVADIFRRFLAGPVVAGQDFGQIGNINLGGELHFIVESADQLDYKFLARGKPDNVGHFSRGDVQAFQPILAGTNH